MLHRMIHFPHVLRAPDDGSGGSGGSEPGEQPPAQAQGQGEGNALLGQIKDLVTGELASFKDSMHADIRRQIDGITKTGKQTAPSKQTKPSEQPTAPSMDEVENMLARRDALHTAISGVTLSPGARNRMLSAFKSEAPENVEEWAKGYLSDFGLTGSGDSSKTATPTEAGKTLTPPANNPGPADPPREFTPDTKLIHMRPEDRAHLIKTKGLAWYRATLREQMAGVTVKVR